MGKKRFTEEQIAFVKDAVRDGMSVTGATKKMCESYDLEYNENVGRVMRRRINNNAVFKLEDTEAFKNALVKKHDSEKKRFLVSWAQNDTPVNHGLLDNMEAYAKHIDAEILIILGRYKNPTLFIKPEQSTWDARVLPYAIAGRIRLHPYLQVLADVKTQPTAVNPLSGLNALSGLESSIIGHPKMAMESLPVLRDYPHKLLISTGAVTVENYSDTSAGKKGEFHHSMGFVVAELDGDNFYIREVSSDRDGSFYDLEAKVSNGEVSYPFGAVDTVVLGDIHAANIDTLAFDRSIGMLNRFNPKHVILHDVLDGESISHHHNRDPFKLLQKENDGVTLDKELDKTTDLVDKLLQWNPVVVAANHNFHLDKFLCDTDWRKSSNRHSYLKLSLAVANGECENGVLSYIIGKRFGDKVICLGYNDSFRRCGVELAVHGDIGSNGSKGSVNQYKYYNTKIICGHTHTPRRQLGYSSVGTLSKLDLEYNKGASSWMHSNIILHENGKRQSLHLIGENKFYTTIKQNNHEN